jgi:DNA polymerase III alpha subunit
VLGLRMMSVFSEAQSMVVASDVAARAKNRAFDAQTVDAQPFDVDALSLDDPKTYELIRSGQTLGLFQIESPASGTYWREPSPTL